MTTLRVSVAPPSSESLERYATRVAGRPFNHEFYPGGARPERDLRVIRLSCDLGTGRSCYNRGRTLLQQWQMHSGSTTTGILVLPDGVLITWARMLPGLWVLNPCRTLSLPQIPAEQRTAGISMVGYATTRGHLIAGCERMAVRHQRRTGRVTFELESISRGAGLVGRAIFPLIAPAQHRFFSSQLRCMQRAAAS
jgi:uncharacterized protein (UPF0548 family)